MPTSGRLMPADSPLVGLSALLSQGRTDLFREGPTESEHPPRIDLTRLETDFQAKVAEHAVRGCSIADPNHRC